MKQYLSPEQTAKLIELGFKKLKSISSVTVIRKGTDSGYDDVIVEQAYSIGDLIEMLPEYIERIDAIFIDALLNIGYDFFAHCWVVAYIDDDEYKYRTSGSELIDALYDMVCKLKESGYARR